MIKKCMVCGSKYYNSVRLAKGAKDCMVSMRLMVICNKCDSKYEVNLNRWSIKLKEKHGQRTLGGSRA